MGKGNCMKWMLCAVTALIFTSTVFSQDEDLPFGVITLDSFTVTAVQQGLKINDLIQIMKYDSSLYIAFNNLHFIEHTYLNEVETFDRKGRQAAYRKEKVIQTYDGRCRQQEKEILESSGSLLNRKGEPVYYTVDLFERTFYTSRKVCGEKRKTQWRETVYGSKEEGHLGAVKRAVFNPGTPVDLPIIGKKFALFEPSMQEFYDYRIETRLEDGDKFYDFIIQVKPEHANSRKNVIVRKLTTTFRAKDLQVFRRTYTLQYIGALIKMNFGMDVQLIERQGRYYPGQLHYAGSWKVPFRSLESMNLSTIFDYGE